MQEEGLFAPELERWAEELSGTERYCPLDGSYSVIADERGDDRPFLTIVMRTQGKRMAAFAQALDALEEQADKGFELIVVIHNAPESADGILAAIRAHGGLSGRWACALVSGGGSFSAIEHRPFVGSRNILCRA